MLKNWMPQNGMPCCGLQGGRVEKWQKESGSSLFCWEWTTKLEKILHIKKKNICPGNGTGEKNKEELEDAKKPIIWKNGRAYKRRAGGYGRRGAGDGSG